jgi:hypothetical protein
MNPLYIIAGALLFMHFARKPHKQSTVNTPTGVMNTQTNHGTLFDYSNGRTPPNFAAGYENLNAVGNGATMRPLQLSADPVLEAYGGTTRPMFLSANPMLEALGGTMKPMLISPLP